MSSSLLKVIACIAMACDHVGYLMQSYGVGEYDVSYWLRVIGRIAFPIFAFLIAEGYKRTRNVVFYAGRLFLAGIISEIPFNLCFGKALRNPNGMNVMFTLTVALLALIFADMCLRSPKKEVRFLFLIPILTACYAANSFGLDYGYWGVILIFLFYTVNGSSAGKKLQLIPVVLLFAVRRIIEDVVLSGNIGNWSKVQIYALFALIPLLLYNGKIGKNHSGASKKVKQYLFYFFYPVHMLILWLIFSNIHHILN